VTNHQFIKKVSFIMTSTFSKTMKSIISRIIYNNMKDSLTKPKICITTLMIIKIPIILKLMIISALNHNNNHMVNPSFNSKTIIRNDSSSTLLNRIKGLYGRSQVKANLTKNDIKSNLLINSKTTIGKSTVLPR